MHVLLVLLLLSFFFSIKKAVQVQEGTDTFTIPASFARAASPPPSTRRRMQRDDSSTRTSAAPSEVREVRARTYSR